MSRHSTLFAQMLKLVPRHEFETLAKECHAGQKLRKMTHWSQFVAMLLMAQLTSARDCGTSQPKNAYNFLYFTPERPSVKYRLTLVGGQAEVAGFLAGLLLGAPSVFPENRENKAIPADLCGLHRRAK